MHKHTHKRTITGRAQIRAHGGGDYWVPDPPCSPHRVGTLDSSEALWGLGECAVAYVDIDFAKLSFTNTRPSHRIQSPTAYHTTTIAQGLQDARQQGD